MLVFSSGGIQRGILEGTLQLVDPGGVCGFLMYHLFNRLRAFRLAKVKKQKIRGVVGCGLCVLAAWVEMGSKSNPNDQAPFSPHFGPGGC
jgi:hypothetical protein